MNKTKIASLLGRLGEEMVERAETEQEPLHFFLYNEVAPGMMSRSLYRVSENKITYIFTSDNIDDLVWDLWEEEEYGKR